MPSVRRRGERITSTVQNVQDTEVVRGAPEEKMATHQRGSSKQEDTYCQKAAELRQLGTFAYNIKFK